MILLATAFVFMLVIILTLLIKRNVQRIVKKKYSRLIVSDTKEDVYYLSEGVG